ncbi:MAG: hypothetical protein QXX30_00960 [Candidatus Aenigmatarchaeota archaeon]
MENYYLIEWESNSELLHLIEGGASCFTEAFCLSTGVSSGSSYPTTRKVGKPSSLVIRAISNYIPKINFVKCNSSPPYRGWRLLAKILLKNVIVEGELYIYFHESFCMDSYGVKIKDGKAYLIEPEIKWKIVSEIKSN